jgi:hypothetical protein
MNFYTINQDRSFTKWAAMLPKSEEHRLSLNENITQHSFWEDPQTIQMKMQSYQDLTSTVLYADTHEWKHDTRLEMVPPPWANKVIISHRFKSLLDDFEGPKHRFYPMLMSNYFNTADEKRFYFLLHIPYYHFLNLDYSRVTFVVAPYEEMHNPYKRFGEGEIRSYDDYLRVANDIQVEFPDGILEPLVWIYDRPWDFMWSTTDGIIVSERIKQRAWQDGLVGVSFDLFEDVQIITNITG